MRKKMKLLETLQEIDLKIDGRKSEKDSCLSGIEELDRQLDEARSTIAALEAETADLAVGREEIEKNLAAETENIGRSETRLSDIKTQKEYQAVLKEISTSKKVKAELEEQVLQKIAQMEEIGASVESKRGDLDQMEKNLAERKAELQGKLQVLEEEMGRDAAEREAAAGGLPPSILNRYSMLRERRQGIAVVEARGGSCLGCNMNIPPQLYNTLHKGEELLSCPHCQRLLYLKKEDEQQ